MRQLRTQVSADGAEGRAGRLTVSLAEVPVPEPGPDEVIVRVEATPINPSDLGLLFAGADLTAATVDGPPDSPMLNAPIPVGAMPGLAGRVGQSLPVGNEGAGTVVAAGSSSDAQALVGRVVATLGGGMYSEYRCMPVDQCLVVHEGTSAREAASCFVNPLTALGMVETMRLDGHTALVHTAAASNLGQMLLKICLADGVDLVAIVRRPEQASLLRDLGVTYVCDSSQPTFEVDLTAALVETGATVAFDAVGGGSLVDQILASMEAAVLQRQAAAGEPYSRYGSTVHKQVYLYGRLDPGPALVTRRYGMAWGIGGWLLPPFLARVGPERAAELRQRVADELGTIFASSYSGEITLVGALDPDKIATYTKMATGQKYLIIPNEV